MKLARLQCLLFAAVVLAGSATLRAEPAAREHEIKAVFLLNFAQFVEWPEGTFATTNSPIVVGILGDDPFGPALDQAAVGEQPQGRPLIILRGRRLEDVAGCHLLFVSKSENAKVGQILRALQNKPVLTVGETEPFRQAGGIIVFVIQGNRVSFDIDDAVARRNMLILSAKLLKAARNVRCPPPGTP
jgi:hypothetical protein